MRGKVRQRGMKVIFVCIGIAAWLVAVWLTNETRRRGRP